MKDSFTPERLSFARSRAGLTRARLSKEVGISPRTIANYEDGASAPGPETVQDLANALDVPQAFFYAPPAADISPGAVSFRALSKMSAVRRDTALTSGALAIELNSWLEERLHMPAPDVPTYESSASDPAAAAQRLRFAWEMGFAKIPNMVHLLEAHGVRVFSLPEALAEVDAFSFWWHGVPFMVLNTRKSAERGRFDAAHELGHLVMHSEYDLPRGRERELEANRFAAAFLMPEEDVLSRGLRNAGLDRVLQEKSRWGVAAMALTHRLHELGLTSDWVYASTCRRLAQMGYRRGEPDTTHIPRETSLVLEKALAALRERGIRTVDVAAALRVNPTTLHDLLFGLVMTPVPGGGVSSPGGAGQLHIVQG